eukprot:GHVT01033110.1.p1 GENE.GHVT01033110.1~~GHVT01033110.1.p1  ORF type:complete len:324 (+),score=41.06 GHVT01033110.1:885-1856(+)
MAGQWWRRGLAVAGNRLPVGTPCLGFNFFVNSGTTLGGSRCSTVSNVSCGSAPSLCGLTCSPRTSLLSSWGEGGPAHRWRQRISPSWGRPLFSVAEAPYEHQESRLVAYTPQEYFAVVLNVPEYKQFLPWCKDSRLVGGAMPNLTHTSARTKPATQIRLYLPQNETQPPSVSLPHSSTSACSSDSSTATSLGPCAPSTVFAPAVDFKNDGEAQTTLGGHTSNHQSAFQAKLAVGFGRVYEEYTSNVSFTTPHVIEVKNRKRARAGKESIQTTGAPKPGGEAGGNHKDKKNGKEKKTLGNGSKRDEKNRQMDGKLKKREAQMNA